MGKAAESRALVVEKEVVLMVYLGGKRELKKYAKCCNIEQSI